MLIVIINIWYVMGEKEMVLKMHWLLKKPVFVKVGSGSGA